MPANTMVRDLRTQGVPATSLVAVTEFPACCNVIETSVCGEVVKEPKTNGDVPKVSQMTGVGTQMCRPLLIPPHRAESRALPQAPLVAMPTVRRGAVLRGNVFSCV
jgi:hypothetical protein